MIGQGFERAIVFSAPLVSALVCLTLVALDMRRGDTHPVRRAIHRQAMSTYCVFALTWMSMVLYSVWPAAFVWALPIVVPTMLLSYVLFYRTIRAITDTGHECEFPRVHFYGVVVVAVAMLSARLAVPIERLTGVIYGLPGYGVPASNLAVYLVSATCLAYSWVYLGMSLAQIWHYRRSGTIRRRGGGVIFGKIAKSSLISGETSDGTVSGGGATPNTVSGATSNTTSDKPGGTISGTIPSHSHARSLDLLFMAILVELIVLPASIFGLMLGLPPFADLGFSWAVVTVPAMIIYIAICDNLLSGNYIVIEPEVAKSPQPVESANRLTRERVERYLDDKKPWLDPSFRIGDMAGDLFTNRAYLSGFINKEYGANFSRLINALRIKEVERLREEAEERRRHVPIMQLILNAGFGNYRSYLRACALAAEDGTSDNASDDFDNQYDPDDEGDETANEERPTED
ncbi:MAG: hypothetical protein LBV38_06875 [Alistipes sp.]|jgi:AraC-like DNA-binding protein|nr:hypothetical protein [Alistipes sp.]